MSSRIVIILTDSTPLNIETGKLEQLFLEDSTLFCRKLGHKYLMSIWLSLIHISLVYTLPNSIPAGNYEAEIGIRYQESYPYRDIWLGVSHNTEDTLTYVTDTLQLFLVDEAGNKTGNGLCGLYQCNLPYKAFIPIRTEGSTRTFRIVHIMRDNPLTGISDIGIQLRKLENQ